ncbi:MAG: DNA repair protein RadC [Muribaculaceae bacterium]|nr:DNA repair protein RadC [Muribaculaceae bacterium]
MTQMKMTREDFGLEVREDESHDSAPVLTIKEMSSDERPQERAIAHGIESLTDAELLALMLRTGQRGMPITDLCRQLMADNDHSLLRLARRSRNELMLTKGIGETKALQVEAMMELTRRYHREMIDSGTRQLETLKASATIYNRLRYRIANLAHEEVWIILLNRRNQIIKEFRLTSGSSVASVFDIKMIIKRALLENAEGLAMCHNHPSGNLRPSAQDDGITRKLFAACQTMDIRMIDHVIFSVDGYYSYADEGRLC